MTQEQHPITPPLELVNKWLQDGPEYYDLDLLKYIATQAARWGADQELEACCEWAAEQDRGFDDELRAARRPKPPSLKELALKQLECVDGILRNQGMIKTDTIRRALEALPE